MIKNKLLLVAIVATSLLLPATVRAIGIEIHVGDRPYYNHGPRYWANDYEMIWVPGHMWHRNWVHGHYIRGENRRHHGNRHHNDHNDNDYRENYRP